ncbi:MAG: hypothetical protein ACEY29_03030 [Arsenophonus sp.]
MILISNLFIKTLQLIDFTIYFIVIRSLKTTLYLDPASNNSSIFSS